MTKFLLEKYTLNTLFANLCCSKCKNDFSQNSFKILEQKKTILICKLVCEKCGKDFGEIILNVDDKKKILPLEVVEGPDPISYDDVIDAHNYIKKNL